MDWVKAISMAASGPAGQSDPVALPAIEAPRSPAGVRLCAADGLPCGGTHADRAEGGGPAATPMPTPDRRATPGR